MSEPLDATQGNKDPDAYRNYQYYRRYLENTQEWREERDRIENIYHGKVFETSEGQDAQSNRETTLVDNRLRPLVRKRVSKLVANKPTGKIFGISDEDQSMVDTFSAMADFFWDQSDGHKEVSDCVAAQQRTGAGYLLLYYDPDADYGLGELKFKYLSYRDVFYDKQARKIEEAPRVIVRRLMDADQFFEDYPEYKEDRPQMLHPDDTVRYGMEGTDRSITDVELPATFEGGEKEFVLLLETYEPKKVDGFVFRDLGPNGKLLTAMKGKKDGYFATEEAFVESLEPEDQAMYEAGAALVYEARIPMVKVTQTAGDMVKLGEPEWIELDSVPIIEMRGEDTFNGEPRGELDYLSENQVFMSKALNLVISNAAMGSLLRFIINSNVKFEMTEEEITEKLTTHGGMLFLPFDPITGKPPVETIKPEPINDTFVYLMNYMAITMEYGLQQHGLTMGDSSQAPRTLGATLQIGEWADEALVLPRVEIERGIQRLYDLYFQWAPQVYTDFKVFSTYDSDTDTEQTYALGEPSIAIEQLYKDEPLVMLTNMSNFRARWRVHAGSMAPSRSVEKAQLFKDLLQVTQNPAFLKPLLEHLPLSKNKQELSEALDLIPQLQQQLQQLQEQNNQLNGEIQRERTQNVELRKNVNVQKASEKYNMAAQTAISDAKNAVKDFERDLDVAEAKQTNKSE